MTTGTERGADCPYCGTPGWYGADCPTGRHRPRVRSRTRVLLVVAVAAVVLAGGLAAVLLLRPAPTPVAGGAAAAELRIPPAPAPAPLPDPAAELDRLVADDAPTAESLVGRWAPQVSSTTLGTVDGVLADIRFWQERYPASIVVRSADFSSFQRPGFWVTLVPPGYATAAEALAWCEAEGLVPDDCFAKRLSHTDPPDGNTVLRRPPDVTNG